MIISQADEKRVPFSKQLDFGDSSHIREYKWMFLLIEREKEREIGGAIRIASIRLFFQMHPTPYLETRLFSSIRGLYSNLKT